MSIEQAYNSLLVALAREEKTKRMRGAPTYGPPSLDDHWRAGVVLNQMNNTELLEALIQHEED